jgi:hypothetical protein
MSKFYSCLLRAGPDWGQNFHRALSLSRGGAISPMLNFLGRTGLEPGQPYGQSGPGYEPKRWIMDLDHAVMNERLMQAHNNIGSEFGSHHV